MSDKPNRTAMDRREFVSISSAAAALLALPIALKANRAVEPVAQTEALSDWTIDDMWGVYPRYSEAIGYGRPRHDAEIAVDAVDAPFVP